MTRLSYGPFIALFTADAGTNIEQLNGLSDNTSVTFVKVSHDGSRLGMDEWYLKSIHPLISVISVGSK